jgi:hypothetical protein
MWKTGKNPLLKKYSCGSLNAIMYLPETQWRSFLVEELSFCAFNSRSAHHFIHLVYGPNAKQELREHLGIDFGWSESNTHIEMLQQPPITQVASNTQTDDEVVAGDHDNDAEDSSGVNENDMRIGIASSFMDASNSVDGRIGCRGGRRSSNTRPQ